MNRVTEMVLGIIGGLIGFGAAFFALFMGTIDAAVNEAASGLTALGISAFVFSGLAVIGAIAVKWKPVFCGWVMAVSGLILLISLGLFGVVPALFLIPAGLMGIIRKEKQPAAAES
ncbi:hypothetical protein [Alteribacillus persepolensis]|nr:hypothetical protein [Alteribacillus persepolensis]